MDPNQPLFYHLVSRCVRRGWLCGYDRRRQKDYSYRKLWFTSRMRELGQSFAIEIYAYAIMSNHFHLVVYYDPKACHRWSDIEVVDRWLRICPPKSSFAALDSRERIRCELLNDPTALLHMRKTLGSLSMFMKFLKQPIARRANIEDDVTGHFFDQRFYSAALLDDEAVLAAMAYVDLNPVRARIARNLEQCAHTSIHERMKRRTGRASLSEYLKPVVSGLGSRRRFPITLQAYMRRLRVLSSRKSQIVLPDSIRWHSQVFAFKKRQRAYGHTERLKAWLGARGMQCREDALA